MREDKVLDQISACQEGAVEEVQVNLGEDAPALASPAVRARLRALEPEQAADVAELGTLAADVPRLPTAQNENPAAPAGEGAKGGISFLEPMVAGGRFVGLPTRKWQAVHRAA